MLRRAELPLSTGESVVLDATWSASRWREDAARLADATSSDLSQLRCEVADGTADARIATRTTTSDPDARIAAAVRAAFESWPDAVAVDTTQPIERSVPAAVRVVHPADRERSRPTAEDASWLMPRPTTMATRLEPALADEKPSREPRSPMDLESMTSTAEALVAPGKGILAADESSPTIAKRLAAVGLESTEPLRRAYREMLFSTTGLGEFISGVILFDETIRQRAADGTPFPELLRRQGVIPGIKVDAGTKPLAGFPDEVVTEGSGGRPDSHRGARGADGRHHSLERCAEVTVKALRAVYDQLSRHRVVLEASLLKPNMVLPGEDCPVPASDDEIAERTITALRQVVPAAVPGLVFLSGGQSDQQATSRLDALNRRGPQRWQLGFSFGRALQGPVLRAWAGDDENLPAAQAALLHRGRLNGEARLGSYCPAMEGAS
jgi:fructose-bisphosphate aldolase class I